MTATEKAAPIPALTGVKAFAEPDGSYTLRKEYGCINGLSAWFTLATVHTHDEAEIGYTDGAIHSPEDVARALEDRAARSAPGVEEALRNAIANVGLHLRSIRYHREAADRITELEAQLASASIEGERRGLERGAEKCRELALGWIEARNNPNSFEASALLEAEDEIAALIPEAPAREAE